MYPSVGSAYPVPQRQVPNMKKFACTLTQDCTRLWYIRIGTRVVLFDDNITLILAPDFLLSLLKFGMPDINPSDMTSHWVDIVYVLCAWVSRLLIQKVCLCHHCLLVRIHPLKQSTLTWADIFGTS